MSYDYHYAEVAQKERELEAHFDHKRQLHEMEQLPILDNGWTHCQFCSNPVPPLEENLTGFGEVYPDPNPMCDDCYDKGLEPREIGDNDLPF